MNKDVGGFQLFHCNRLRDMSEAKATTFESFLVRLDGSRGSPKVLCNIEGFV